MKKLDAYLKLHLISLGLWFLFLVIFSICFYLMDFTDEKPDEAVAQIEVVTQKQEPKPKTKQSEPHSFITVEILPITDEEVKLLAMIVHSEAEGESATGKMLVAKTVLNRVEFGRYFGKTISAVIFKPGQFDGIKRDFFKAGIYDSEDVDAVLAALDEWGYSDILYFCNPETATDQEYVSAMLSNLVIAEGNHIFSR